MNEPIYVLFYTGSLGVGGSEAHLAQLLTRLDRRRVRPELMLSQAATGYHRLEQVRAAGIPVHDLQITLGKRGILDAMIRIRRMIKKLRPDILQTYGYPADVYAPLLTPVGKGIRLVTTRRGNQQIGRRRLFYRLTTVRVDRVLCVSESARRFAETTQGLPPRRGKVIPNGVDSTLFRPAELRRPSAATIGTHGRLFEIKGTDLLLEAFRSLERPDLALKVAGAVVDDWGARLRERHEGDRVAFTGDLDDVPEFLRSLDIYVLPSRSEGMSMALLEAMASGLPIVATDVGSNRAVLADGEAGLVVAPDVRSIADGIRSLLDDEDRAAALGRAARERARTEFGLDVMVRRYEDFYEDLMRGSTRSRA